MSSSATRLRQGFAGARFMGRRSFSEGGKRTIQYSRDSRFCPRGRRVLDTPLSRGMTAGGVQASDGGSSLPLLTTNSSNCSSLDRILRYPSDLPVALKCRRPFACVVGQIKGIFPRVPRPIRGAYRDRHGRWVRDAMDATRAPDESVCRGRRSRGVLIPRRWYQLLKKLTLLRGDGGKKARFTGETTKETVKTIAQGMPARSANLWWTNSCAFYFSHARLWVRTTRPAFPAPSHFRRGFFDKTRARRCREIAARCHHGLPCSRRTFKRPYIRMIWLG
jgi:hypothetical protein